MNFIQLPAVATKTRDGIIEHFTINIVGYQKLAKNIAGTDDSDDLFQECTLMMLEYNEDRLLSYWNDNEGLKPFFIRMLSLQYKSKTSKFHKKYRKDEQFLSKHSKDIVHNEKSIQLEADPEIEASEVVKALDNVYKIKGQLFPSDLRDEIFILYVETGSLRKCLAALPENIRDVVDLKAVHEIVKDYRRTIKGFVNTGYIRPAVTEVINYSSPRPRSVMTAVKEKTIKVIPVDKDQLNLFAA